jgi:hypothetical protein
MNSAEAFIRAETLWPGEQAMVEPMPEGWLIVTPTGLHLTHTLDADGNPTCHDCKNLAENEAMRPKDSEGARYRGEVFDRVAALEHYSDHSDILIALQKVVDADAEHFKGALRVPGVKIICKACPSLGRA